MILLIFFILYTLQMPINSIKTISFKNSCFKSTY